MRHRRAYALLASVVVLLGTLVLFACGSDAESVESDPDGGTGNEGGGDADGSTSSDGSTFDVILFDAGTPCSGDPSCNRRIAFITQSMYSGGFGSVAAADQACMTEAQTNALLAGRTFRAWLSTNGASAPSRFPSFTASLRRVDGEIVADSMSELLTTGPRVPINRPPSSTTAISSLVWTGTSKDGGAIQDKNCTGWTVAASTLAGVGKSDDLPNWTSIAPDRPCGVPLRIYCVEN